MNKKNLIYFEMMNKLSTIRLKTLIKKMKLYLLNKITIMKKTTLTIIAFIFLMAINHSLQSQPTTIKSFTQNFEKKEGFLNYYWDNNKGRVYLEVKKP